MRRSAPCGNPWHDVPVGEHAPELVNVIHHRDISQLPEHTLLELQRFFEEYKVLENKSVRFEQFLGRVDAQKIVREGVALYRKKFKTRAKAKRR